MAWNSLKVEGAVFVQLLRKGLSHGLPWTQIQTSESTNSSYWIGKWRTSNCKSPYLASEPSSQEVEPPFEPHVFFNDWLFCLLLAYERRRTVPLCQACRNERTGTSERIHTRVTIAKRSMNPSRSLSCTLRNCNSWWVQSGEAISRPHGNYWEGCQSWTRWPMQNQELKHS